MVEEDRCVQVLVQDILKEEGELTTDEILDELFERELAYTVVDGERCRVSKYGLRKLLDGTFRINEIDEDIWKFGSEGRLENRV